MSRIRRVRRLKGLKVLIVEDSPLIALELSTIVGEAGGIVVGPASSVKAAMDLLNQRVIHVALLDVQLNREEVYPVAERLRYELIPFAFVSGHCAHAISRRAKSAEIIISKPFSRKIIVQTLISLDKEIFE